MTRCPRVPIVSVGFGLLLGGCMAAGEEQHRADISTESFDAVFEIVDRITLEESPEVVNVFIEVVPDPRGGYLVADEAEAQVRRYSEDGKLLWYAGRRGLGPGEFSAAVAATRLPSGEIVGQDRRGRLTVFDEGRDEVLATSNTAIALGAGIWALGPDSLLVSGYHPGGPMGPRLHLWSISEERIENSFFSPVEHSPNPDVAAVAAWSKAAFLADTIVAIFATMDTLFFFSMQGRLERKVPFPPSHFRVVQAEPPPRGALSPREQVERLARFDYVGDVFATEQGDLLIPYQSLIPDEALGRRWHLLAMTRDGERLFEVRNGPRLAAKSGESDVFVFRNTEADLPNEWILARLIR